MKYAIAMMMGLGLVGAQAAHADGFECETVQGDLTVKVYNQTDSNAGVRNGAVMVLSDPAVQSGRKTIARFSEENGTLTNSGAHYEANVDLRFNDSGRKGELISGTRLGELDTITLDVEFSYSEPVADGESVKGELTLQKRDGNQITRQLECVRYLKR